MTAISRPALFLAAAVLLATAACSGDPEPAPTEPASSAPAASASTAPTVAPSAPTAECLTGTYRLDRFVGVGASETYGTGEGGDVTVAFADGGYTLAGAGKDPIKLTLAGGTGQLTVDGTVRGTYTGTGPEYDFTVGKSDGSATLKVDDQQQKLDMADAANLIAPKGKAVLACNPPKMVLLLSAVRLELSRS